jgi:glyoxylase-like metal-dependent hydrolase (beta-lactamase superfamily II)
MNRRVLHGSVRVGAHEILAVCDLVADFPTPLRQTFPDVPEEEWSAFQERYPDAFGGEDTWLAHDHCYLIRSPERIILIDTGAGSLPAGIQGLHRTGGLPVALEELGVKAGDIDTVVFTHLHFDHVGWNYVEEDGRYRPHFAKARHIIHADDWEAFDGGADAFSSASFQQRVKPLREEGVVDLIDGRLDLAPGITVEPAPGHTVGHVVVTVEAGDERVVVAGDLVNHPAQLADPTWREIGDQDLDAAAASRRRLFGEGAGAIFAPSHFPEPFGRVSREGDRYVWSPLP